MKLELWYIGKTKFEFIDQGADLFVKRIRRFHPILIQEIPNIKSRKNRSPEEIKSAEAHSILERLDSNDYLVVLDERGQMLSSKQLAVQIEQFMNRSLRKVVFLIGGAYGLDIQILQRANMKLSLSKMTFSHQLIKLIFLEQLYRALSILNNHPYHND